ncbi:biphenyl 2,3-dioxygenase [Croceicoccus marinus]|uniref:Biphenyl 2,3-dioxygenase n=2 Tax=Croceicoccus marinus TaxID=450378 RepID=A0A1Z1FE91_9SPHN|nr:biphenyl 2,3-dioxygenase [Croceicoccus marinus]
MRGAGSTVDDVRLLSLQRFYAMEARLLDEERYQEWYELLADDLFYWLPLRQNRHRREGGDGADPDAMAFFDDCKADIAVRVGRLASGLAWTEDPPTRHVYVISNVEGFETGVAGELEVHSTFIQYRNRSEHDDATIVGRRRDLLRIAGDGYMIARRLVLVPQSVLLTKNLSVFF